MRYQDTYSKTLFGFDSTPKNTDVCYGQHAVGATADSHRFTDRMVASTAIHTLPAMQASSIVSYNGIGNPIAGNVIGSVTGVALTSASSIYGSSDLLSNAYARPDSFTNPISATIDKYPKSSLLAANWFSQRDASSPTTDFIYNNMGVLGSSYVAPNLGISTIDSMRGYPGYESILISNIATDNKYSTSIEKGTIDITNEISHSLCAGSKLIQPRDITSDVQYPCGIYTEITAISSKLSAGTKIETGISLNKTTALAEVFTSASDIRVASSAQGLKRLYSHLLDLAEREQDLIELFERYTQWNENSYENFLRWQNELEFGRIQKSIAKLTKTIFRLGKHLIKLLSKVRQGRRLNKRQIFRAKVNLIFKNLDDAHAVKEYFFFNCNCMLTRFLNIRYYEHRHQ
ncbi:hypothetical protein LLH06_00125 [Mucilaginibacter daejeonensis]|uniref:hypothetical protein n=1 Tax=Mucilaginibacter daejeonensis TaxID=398049 RepID=UPI001D1774E7|nr:hypothetical protein [Mucilaginibacter daejeonensis]UEG53386.1 hypothetical protein LLH06_00125 [Mucilaginibacter daejeonensis]